MAIDEYSLSAEARRAIEQAGYRLYGGMDASIKAWYAWYTATNESFYKVPYFTKKGTKQHRDRYSLRPAKRVCREYASLILTEDTRVSVEGSQANAWLQGYLGQIGFWPNGQNLVERAFALGTGGWFLDYDIREDARSSIIRPQRYDARLIKPLTFDEEGITEAAVDTRVTAKGKPIERLTLYVIDNGTYHVKTRLFREGKELAPESLGYIADFDTESPRKPFGIVRPAIDNAIADMCPYGMSVFADAIDSIKAVDLAFDSLFQEVELTGVKVFMDESLMDVRSEDGKVVPVAPTEDRTFRMVDGDGATKLIDVFSPQIRSEALKGALNVALSELGESCGFGQNYFALDKQGGMKTATEVVADNGALMRSVKKHENVVRTAIQDVVSALLDGARIHCGVDIEEDFGTVDVAFDDSVITDTQTAKNTMLAEIAAGVVPKWKYMTEFYGMTEAQAKAEMPQEAIIDPGF